MRLKKNLLLLLGLLYLLSSAKSLSTQQNVTLVVDAQPQQWLRLWIDGVDPGWGATTNEICDLGNLDARGTPITGATSGLPDINGIAGIPVSSTGAPLASSNDPDCIGSFYPIFSATGGNFWIQHPSSALVILVSSSETWQLYTQAQLTSQTINVTAEQLKWKSDSTSSSGYQGYTDFTSANTLISSGNPVFFRFLYLDLGLLVEYEDEPGTNVWSIIYTLTSF